MKIMINGETVDATPEQEAGMIALSNYQDISSYNLALQMAIDRKAEERQYAGGVACASYCNSTNAQWAEEAQTFIAWRDSVFAYGYHYLEQVQSGEIPNPSIESFLSGMPGMVWPELQN